MTLPLSRHQHPPAADSSHKIPFHHHLQHHVGGGGGGGGGVCGGHGGSPLLLSSFRTWQLAMLMMSLILVFTLSQQHTTWASWSPAVAFTTTTSNKIDSTNPAATTNDYAEQSKKYRGWVMMHTLKAGGNSVERLLKSVGYQQRSNHSLYQKGRNNGYVYFEKDDDHDTAAAATTTGVDTNINRLWYNKYMAQWPDGKDAFFSALPRDEFFKIGLVREPCDYTVSIWAFSGRGAHGFLTGKCAGKESKNNFTQFLHETSLPFQFGWLSYRVALQLGAAGKEKIGATTCPSKASAATLSRIEALAANLNATQAADCWVRTENLVHDLRQCLQLYVRQRGGETSMTLNKFPGRRTPRANRGQHKACSEYYSEQDAIAVWEREGRFAEQFGYSGCCKGLVVEDHSSI